MLLILSVRCHETLRHRQGGRSATLQPVDFSSWGCANTDAGRPVVRVRSSAKPSQFAMKLGCLLALCERTRARCHTVAVRI